MNYDKQVDKNHYSFEQYFFPERWMSYYYQTKEIVNRNDIRAVLDVGPGTSFLHDVLKIHRSDISYKALDVAQDVHPDYIGSVTKIPLEDSSFDLISAFQVLEHIEYKDVETALLEMKRVSRKYVFISLPHFGPSFELLIKVPFINRIRLAGKATHAPTHVFNGQHYWEIGKKGYSVRKIRRLMQRHFNIIDEYVPFENQYHRFYIMELKPSE